MDKPTLTIVVPAFNEERHLDTCLKSISNQTVTPDEVIVVDNNSTDETTNIARSYPFVKLAKEKKQGITFARNKGFDTASSQIIGRIDADTILPHNWVERVKSFYCEAQHDKYALTGGAVFYNLPMPRFSGWAQGQVAFRVNRLLMGHYILYGSNMAITNKMWQQVRTEACLENDIHEDLDLAMHLHDNGYEITYKESLRVGVKMRRVLTNQSKLWHNMMLWPNTLKRHDKKSWVFGWIGAVILYAGWPIVYAIERTARLLGYRPRKTPKTIS